MLINVDELHSIHNRFKICTPLFIALSDEIRQKLILDIADAGNEGINVTNLCNKSDLSRPAISHHLKILKDADLLRPVKNGTQIFYKLNLKDNLIEFQELIKSIQNVITKIEQSDEKTI